MRRLRVALAVFLVILICVSALTPARHFAFTEGARQNVFIIPEGVVEIGAEAFYGIAKFDAVMIPASVTKIADDAFGALTGVTVLGLEDTEAERFAARAGLEFASADVSVTSITAAPWTSPFVAYTVSAEATSAYGDITYRFYALMPDGESVYMESGEVPSGAHTFLFEQGGEYIIKVVCSNGAGERALTARVNVAQPLALAGEFDYSLDDKLIEVGQSARLISEDEARTVVLSSSAPEIARVNGLNIEGVSAGDCVITALAPTPEGDVYAYIPLSVVVPVSSISIVSPPDEIAIGDSVSLDVSVMPPEAYDKTVTWSVEDERVAVIDEYGVLTGVAPGVTNVIARAGRFEDSFSLRVVKLAESVTITPEGEPPVQFLTGQTLKLSASVSPPDADARGVIWSSEDEYIASVDARGVVSAISAGQVRVFATSTDAGAARGEYPITVVQGAAQIDIVCASALEVGHTAQASARISPADAVNTDVVWTSSDESVLAVSADGRVTALSGGSALLCATALNGVTARLPILCVVRETSIFSALTDVYLTPKVPTCDPYLFMFAKPMNATYRSLTWSSSNPLVASVDPDTGLITAHVVGTARITATSHHGVTKSINVHAVTDGEVIAGMTLKSSYLALTQGESASNSVQGLTGSPTSQYISGTWYSDNESVATALAVNGATTITAVAPGTANIYAVAVSGRTAKCEVLVNPRVQRGITLSASNVTIDLGEQYALTATLLPEQSYFDSISWSSSVPTVASVINGVVYSLSDGVTVITATTGAGLKATCVVNVNRVTNMTSAALNNDNISGVIGGQAQLAYTYAPASAYPARFYWTSDDETVARVDASSGLVRFMSAGECVITGIATDFSSITLSARVNVTGVPVSGISLDNSTITLSFDDTYQLSPIITPQNANHAGILYASSDEDIATVDAGGVIRAVAAGSCDITVSAGAQSALVRVNVTAPADVVYRALVVGDFTIPTQTSFLPFSTNGTTGVRDAFSRSRLDGKRYSINLLGSNPSKNSIYAAINYIAASADADDVTVIYLLTHGGNSVSRGGYFMDLSAVSGDYMTAASILERVKGISGSVLLVLCSCHSGYMLETSATKTLMSAGGAYTGNHGAGKLSILCSSSRTLSSYYDTPDTSLSRDFFTYAFLRGLGWDMIADGALSRPYADSDRDGYVTISELANYSRINTQSAISAFIQANGTSQFHGSDQQYPRWFIADGEADTVIFGR